LLSRDSASIERARAAASLLRGGVAPEEVAAAVRRTEAKIVHAHNLHPSFGWRALAAAKEAGAKVVLHLHQYRLVCAVGVCFTDGEECLRCKGRNTLPGVLRNCRGSWPEALAYGAALSLWQRRIVELADAFVVPSEFAAERLRELRAPLRPDRVHVLAPPIELPAPREGDRPAGRHALVVSRLAPEKGVDVAIDACLAAGRPLLIAGDGPERHALQARVVSARAPKDAVRFLGSVSDSELRALRERAAVALVPSRSAETFGIAAAEAMAQGVPVVGSDVGALAELLDSDALVPQGSPQALAEAMQRRWGDLDAGERGRLRVAERCAPETVAQRLKRVYEAVAGDA